MARDLFSYSPIFSSYVLYLDSANLVNISDVILCNDKTFNHDKCKLFTMRIRMYVERTLECFSPLKNSGKKKKKINCDNSLMRKVAKKIQSASSSHDFYHSHSYDNPEFPDDTVIVSETIWSYGNDHVVARKSSSGRSIDGE